MPNSLIPKLIAELFLNKKARNKFRTPSVILDRLNCNLVLFLFVAIENTIMQYTSGKLNSKGGGFGDAAAGLSRSPSSEFLCVSD